MTTRFSNFDLFGIGIKFNLRGQEEFKTNGGAFVSILLIFTVTLFAVYRAVILATITNTSFNDI